MARTLAEGPFFARSPPDLAVHHARGRYVTNRYCQDGEHNCMEKANLAWKATMVHSVLGDLGSLLRHLAPVLVGRSLGTAVKRPLGMLETAFIANRRGLTR